MNYSDKMTARYGYYVGRQAIRRVWAAVTQQPCATVRELARVAQLDYRGVACAIRVLHDAGYIDAPPKLARARRVLVPFVVLSS